MTLKGRRIKKLNAYLNLMVFNFPFYSKIVYVMNAITVAL